MTCSTSTPRLIPAVRTRIASAAAIPMLLPIERIRFHIEAALGAVRRRQRREGQHAERPDDRAGAEALHQAGPEHRRGADLEVPARHPPARRRRATGSPRAICSRRSIAGPSRARIIIAMNRPTPRGLSRRPMVAIG